MLLAFLKILEENVYEILRIFNRYCELLCYTTACFKVGYSMTGGPERTCLSNRMWSGTSVTCGLVMCQELTAPSYGDIR